MIHQFALEYASKCLLHTNTNGVTTRTSSPLSETSDTPLDLTVTRTQEEKEKEPEPGEENYCYKAFTQVKQSIELQYEALLGVKLTNFDFTQCLMN